MVFDPLLAGPRAQGGPWLLQVWRRAPDGTFERVHEGKHAAWSCPLDAHLVPDQEGRRLLIAAEADGSRRWLTGEERALQRAAEANARATEANARAEAANAREHAALKRLAELEAELARRSG